MKLFFEEQHYSIDQLEGLIDKRYYIPVSKNSEFYKINYVGYFFNSKLNEGKGDSVLIFPKVFLIGTNFKTRKAFGSFDPLLIIDYNPEQLLKLSGDKKSIELIYEMSTWIYRAIDQYTINVSNQNISNEAEINPVLSKKDVHSTSELEIIEALRLFKAKNKELFAFISQKSNSQKYKINWSKTIAKKTPFFSRGKPYYFDVSSTKKQINYDDELIRIFFSVLNFLKDKYGFRFSLNLNYKLYKGSAYKRLELQGSRYLKSIRYKLYSDKMIKLHGLLSAYFNRIDRSNSRKLEEEFLLVKDFNRVFEDMIDRLIGDQITGEIAILKNHPDGKQLDHIYKENGYFQKESIYAIADSKYYQDQAALQINSKFKQFTYARNVITLNVDIIKDYIKDDSIRYQDKDFTEGYHPTPNFFISAFFDKELVNSYHGLDFAPNKENFYDLQAHWENRLFDRDTLFTLSYKINFMFVLSTYVNNNKMVKDKFKKSTRDRFRNEFVGFLNDRYNFYNLIPKVLDLTTAIEKDFKLLNGISFKPNDDDDNKIIIALEKGKTCKEMTEDKILRKLNSNWTISNKILEDEH
jgi:hypothetical protein